MSLYPWQEEALKVIGKENAIISAPTNSGKTKVAYIWADFPSAFSFLHRVVYTAPIKALANEKYDELTGLYGSEVIGLITGDVKINPNAPVIVCTQEIYSRSLVSSNENMRIIIDEFHYIFSATERTRAYIDGIRYAKDNHKFLILSATFGNPKRIKQYLERVSGKRFILYETDFRPTRLEFTDKVFEISNVPPYSLVYVFNISVIQKIVKYATAVFPPLPVLKRRKIKTIAIEYGINLEKFPEVFHGIALYHSKLTYSQKRFIERLIREKFIQIIFSTDALGVGVNLPFEYVLFATLGKPESSGRFLPISKIEFLQLSGRAGRKGYYDVGYVGLLMHSFDRRTSFSTTQSLYKELVYKDLEEPEILLNFDIEKLVKGETTIEDEIQYISKYSDPPVPIEVLTEVAEYIKEFLSKLDKRERQFLKKFYLVELSPSENLEFTKRILSSKIYLRRSKKLRKEIFCFDLDSSILSFLRSDDTIIYEGAMLNYLLKIRRIMKKTHYEEFNGIYIYWKDLKEVEKRIRLLDPLILRGGRYHE